MVRETAEKIRQRFVQVIRHASERGAGMVEYALLIALLALALITSTGFIGSVLADSFEKSGSSVHSAAS